MAYSIVRKNFRAGTDQPADPPEITAVADTTADLTDIGTDWAAGSVVFIPGTGVKVLNASKNWI